jgi:uncharacterized protein with FMN-binding domain
MNKADGGGDEIKKLGAGLTLLILTVVIVGTVVISRPKSTLGNAQAANTATAASTSKQTSAPTQKPAATAGYKDGTYSATGHYDSPGGTEGIKVSLTLVDDKVSATNVQSDANDPTAQSYQTIFISGYKSFVVGKKINTIQLSNVSGSSLTSQGFNDALKQIENQAQA